MEMVPDSESNLSIPAEVIDGPAVVDVQVSEATIATQAMSGVVESQRQMSPAERLAKGSWWRSSDVAKEFGVTPRAVTSWANGGKIPAIRTPGGHWRYNEEEILRIRDAATTGEPFPPETKP